MVAVLHTDTKPNDVMETVPVDDVIKRIYKKDGGLILRSVIAGAAAFCASWGASMLVAGALPSPMQNAGTGVAVSVFVYFIAFFALSLFSTKKDGKRLTIMNVQRQLYRCVQTVGLKEVFEQSVRFGLHVGLMSLGLTPTIASPIAQLVAGGLGHISVPLFANIAIVAKAKKLGNHPFP